MVDLVSLLVHCPTPKSSQILWSCGTILEEASPVLYNNTIFSMSETLDFRRHLFRETSKHFRNFEILASAQADHHRWGSITTHLNDSPLQYCKIMVVGAHWSHQNNLNPPPHDSDLGKYPEVYKVVRKQAFELLACSSTLDAMKDQSKDGLMVCFVLEQTYVAVENAGMVSHVSLSLTMLTRNQLHVRKA